MGKQRVLIADDEEKSNQILRRVLQNQGWEVDTASDGKVALDKLLSTDYEVVILDLNMSGLNGMQLASCINIQLSYQPLVLMVSGLLSNEIKKRAKGLGVYQCLSKPLDFKELSQAFHSGLHEINKRKLERPENTSNPPGDNSESPPSSRPDFGVVGIAVSTGGPQTLKTLFQQLPADFPLPILIVIHSPDWAIQTFIRLFNNLFSFVFQVAESGQIPERGNVYIAPADNHLELLSETGAIRIHQGPMENFVRPAADPLFRSLAKGFGPQAVGLVLSGLGQDGATGSQQMDLAGGSILIQSPDTARAPFMPRAALAANPELSHVPLAKLGKALYDKANAISRKLPKPKETEPIKNPIPAGGAL